MKPCQDILSQIRSKGPPKTGKEQVFSSARDGVSVRVCLSDWDRLAVSLVDLAVTARRPCPPASEEGFEEPCKRLALKLDYLEEPLKAIELDGPGRICFIRSYPPVVKGDRLSYFEIQIRGKDGSISMSRRMKQGSSHRDLPAKAVMGHHLLERLIDDLVDAVSYPKGTEEKAT